MISVKFASLVGAGLQMAYGLSGFFALVSFVFVYFRAPETNGKYLEPMGEDTPGELTPPVTSLTRSSTASNAELRPRTLADPVEAPTPRYRIPCFESPASSSLVAGGELPGTE